MTLWLLAGALIGALNAGIRWWTVSRVWVGLTQRALLLVVGGMTVRLSLIACLLALGLSRGIVPGLLSFGGVWLSRWATVLWFNANGPVLLPASPTPKDRASGGMNAPNDGDPVTQRGSR